MIISYSAMFQLWHRQLKPGPGLYASLIRPVGDRGQPYVFCMGAEIRRGGKRGFSSYPPYLTVLNASVQKHTGTDNKIYVLKVKACKSGFEFPGFFFFLINANKGVNSLPLPGSLRRWDIHLENLYILIASTQNASFPINAVKWTNASFLQHLSPCIMKESVLYDTVSMAPLQLHNTPKTASYIVAFV